MRSQNNAVIFMTNKLSKKGYNAGMNCRLGCGACCIAPSITSPIPGMPDGKPAGVRCIQLNDDNLCKIFGLPERPDLCDRFIAEPDVCGKTSEEALWLITSLETATQS